MKIKIETHEEVIDTKKTTEPSEMTNSQIRALSTPQTQLKHKSNVQAVKRKIILILSGLVLVNIGVWVATAIAFRNFPALLGTAALAYTLGLRHAVDADHLAAIDNVTRKLLQSGQHSVSVGLFFSLGHSTIVIIASIAIAVTATVVKEKFGDLEAIGGLIGTSVSAAFLFIIGIVNCFLLVSILRTLKKLKHNGIIEEESMDDILNNSGIVGRFFGPVFRFIDASWKMYPLGVLFGFGFDTSTEVGLLGISAFQANQGLPIWLIMFFPLLFTSGMALIDTIDGILMLGTYTWAYLNPVRKLYYNFIITLLSVLVAFVIGIIELLNIIGDKLDLHGPFWDFFKALGEHFGTIGYLIIGLFVITWIIAKIVYYCGGYEQLEHKLDQRNIEDLADNEEQSINSTSNQDDDDIKVVVDSGSKNSQICK
ncbi:8301_t:CDS:1 [Funneliformis geosporum]|uniref:Nickel/cobalt efflux system n=1 Tax=Funneliformis geosporum TaxID=1117311 RepID=A0A9W4T1Q2_9GLOM|nr:89_t:CDS:1 [Funneliformis geosporum]CAI2189821.1 8301_t:CDS:1 [Funneliformis geosporum]